VTFRNDFDNGEFDGWLIIALLFAVLVFLVLSLSGGG